LAGRLHPEVVLVGSPPRPGRTRGRPRARMKARTWTIGDRAGRAGSRAGCRGVPGRCPAGGGLRPSRRPRGPMVPPCEAVWPCRPPRAPPRL